MRQDRKFWGSVRAFLKRTNNESGDDLYLIACHESCSTGWFPREDHNLETRNRRNWKRYRRTQWRLKP